MSETPSEKPKKKRISPQSFAAGAAAFAIGLIVCGLTYGLRLVDFGPVKQLIMFEDRLFQVLIPPTLNFQSDPHPIVFIDIDDFAMSNWRQKDFRSSCNPDMVALQGDPLFRADPAEGTPRGMIAALTKLSRQSGAGVVFIDYDLRNRLPDDAALHAELACYSSTPVLIPHYFATGLVPDCLSQTVTQAQGGLTELETKFDDDNTPPTVLPVHTVITTSNYGLIDGVCSSYLVQGEPPTVWQYRPAAMEQAVGLLDPRFRMNTAPEIHQMHRWWIDDKIPYLYDEKKRLAFRHFKANVLLDSDLKIAMPAGSIVIIGSTHRGAGDSYLTPVGELPGALIHANFGLELQAPKMSELPLIIQFLVEAAILVGFAVLTTIATDRLMPDPGRITFWQRLKRISFEFVVTGVLSVAVFAGFARLASWFGETFLAGWRFGILSFMVGAVIGCAIEIVSALADAVEEVAEDFWRSEADACHESQADGPVSPRQRKMTVLVSVTEQSQETTS